MRPSECEPSIPRAQPSPGQSSRRTQLPMWNQERPRQEGGGPCASTEQVLGGGGQETAPQG